jgi:phosphatidate phosphatase APP1
MDPRRVLGYRGYGTRWRGLALGRVLETHNVVPGELHDGGWRNLVNSVRRLNSDPLPYARLLATIGGSTHELRADDEGFVHEWLKLPTPLAEDHWHTLDLTLDIPDRDTAPRTTSQVLVPSPHASFGVISDMDDTVLQSDATTLLRAARLMLLENARTRLPFPGVAAFYRALHDGVGGPAKNPIFYVSSSPWNLYDMIADFLDAREIPVGPMLLRDWDLSSALAGHAGHKSLLIREILDAYPRMRFILVGDSGQEDPEIYAALVSEYAGRILAVYIRDVSQNAERSAAISALAEQMTGSQCSLVLAVDTLTVAKHAAEHGWIDPARLTEIGGEARA